jgi:hypothetical protein
MSEIRNAIDALKSLLGHQTFIAMSRRTEELDKQSKCSHPRDSVKELDEEEFSPYGDYVFVKCLVCGKTWWAEIPQ